MQNSLINYDSVALPLVKTNLYKLLEKNPVKYAFLVYDTVAESIQIFGFDSMPGLTIALRRAQRDYGRNNISNVFNVAENYIVVYP